MTIEQFDPEAWHRWKQLFDSAADLDQEGQQHLLDAHCAGDPRLRERFATMLSAHRESEAIVDRSIPDRFVALSLELRAEPSPPERPLPAGTLLKDRYRIQQVIGKGGWSVVYLARDESMNGRLVVIKLLFHNNAERSAIDDEILALSKLHHPGIAAPLDSGRTSDGRRFLVLAYIPGITLRAALIQNGPLDGGRAVSLLRALGSALETAHAEGVFHLDLKPENIMLHNQGGTIDPIIVDFGISRLLHSPHATSGSPAGSLSYIAPEQLAGEPDTASDQYSLALIAAEMLTGRKPPPLDSAPAILAACAGLPIKARRALKRALSASPSNRFLNVGEFVASITTAIDPQRLRYRRLGIATATGLAIVFLLGTTYLWLDRRHEQQLIASDMALVGEQMGVWVRLADSAPFPEGALEQAFGGPLAHLQRLVSEGHREPELLMTLSNSLALYGTYLGHPGRRSVGQAEKGIAALRQSIEVAHLLGGITNMYWWWCGFTAEKYDMLASILIEAGEYDQASQAAGKGLALLEKFKGHGVNYRSIVSIRGGLVMTLSRVYFHRREFEECLRLRDQGVAIRREVLPLYENSRPARYDLAGVLATRGYLLRDMGRLDEAKRDYDQSETILKPLLEEESSNLQFRWLHARNAM